MDISVRANVKDLQKTLTALANKQIKFATALALTTIAKEVQADEIHNISLVFKKPKPFTQKSVGVKGARKDNLTAIVFVRPIAAKYLEPYEVGGLHVLSGRALLNPKDIKLNAYGQLPRNVLERLKARKDIFIGPVKTKSGSVNGVWQRIPPKEGQKARRGRAASVAQPGHLKLIIRFGDPIIVNKRLNYRSRAQAIVNRRFNAVFGDAMAKALATAK
ncbi:hypothetical protein [Pseudomonas sp. AB6]|uniref:hypothetical protein n=1 Tax=Pseudomonas sp. AB6 TaxID=3048598 RepID=UPI002AB517C0|nr:hypothetical protein [Pseudomonas sp. AB6]MDY7560205.1 hypothetical protein [Pseudomonas sp. AB6]MEB0211392.1 hypothetical protein [Pseudomonas sp. AB6]